MNLLLDTHTLLWSIGKSNELSPRVKREIINPDNDIFVSAVSLWEIALKYSLGKLSIAPLDIREIPAYCKRMGFELTPLDPVDALNSLDLSQKPGHKDPFDRMLIFQCIQNQYIFVSRDAKVKAYAEDGLRRLW